MPKDLVIDSITIEGLRGFNNTQTIEFGGTNAIISGPMGTGKSSTVCAIEWALFGDIAHIKCSESKTQAEFVNANKIDQRARVELKLKGNDGFYIIRREKYAKERYSDLNFSTPTAEYTEDEAEKQIYSIFGTFDDFHRSVFLHQEAIRAILTENPEERDSALDRLFGLEGTRDLMSALPIKKVKDECEELEKNKTNIEQTIKGAIIQAETGIESAKKEAFGLELKEDDFNFNLCLKKYQEIIKNITTATVDCGLEKPSFLEPSNETDLSNGLKKVNNLIKECRKQITNTSKYSELRNEYTHIDEVKTKFKGILEEFDEALKEYKEMENEFGTSKQMEKKEQSFNKRLDELKNQRETIDSTARLISDGIDVLSKQELKNCPICETKISSKVVLAKLQKKVSKSLEITISKITEEETSITENLYQIEENKRKIKNAIKKTKKTEEKMNIALKELQETLLSKSKDKKLLEEAEGKLIELQAEINQVEKPLKEKNDALEKIDNLVDICKAILRVLEKENEYEKIKETFSDEGSQIKIFESQIDKMSSLHDQLQRISEAIATAQIKLARQFIDKGETKMSSYYNSLCGHPYYNSIRIDTQQRNVRGILKNTYNIKAFNNREGKETHVISRFSTGYMNCAALAIFLSLSSMLERTMKFVILDDPSQNLDIDHKSRLVKVLGDVSVENQVIVATQDSELEKEIQNDFTPKGGYITLKYDNWGKDGPAIKKIK